MDGLEVVLQQNSSQGKENDVQVVCSLDFNYMTKRSHNELK